MNVEKGKRKFPSYFNNFEFPKIITDNDLQGEELKVFRACRTSRVDKGSFLNTYEENGFKISKAQELNDPMEYSLSTYIKFKDVKRFMKMTGIYNKPYVIAKGITKHSEGIAFETKKWKNYEHMKYKGSSHVDWWLYEDAEPWKWFEEVDINEYREFI